MRSLKGSGSSSCKCAFLQRCFRFIYGSFDFSEDLSTVTRAVTNELGASGDPALSLLVAKNVAKAVRLFLTKCENTSSGAEMVCILI